MTIEEKIGNTVRNVADFPREGIQFKDVSTLMADPRLMNEVLDELVVRASGLGITKVAGIESRGFLFGPALAMRLSVPFVMIRKEGKLPYEKLSCSYELEYGKAVVEVHKDAFIRGDRVLIHDDLLATGGTVVAAAELIRQFGAKVASLSFLIELIQLNGRDRIKSDTENITTLAAL
jgi:adenine phosphoribosyltransferase